MFKGDYSDILLTTALYIYLQELTHKTKHCVNNCLVHQGRIRIIDLLCYIKCVQIELLTYTCESS